MRVLFEAPDFAIAHDAGNNWLYVTWTGTHPGMTARERCTMILEQVKLTQSSKILNDSTLDLDGWGEMTQWLAREFFQDLAAAGVTAVAWVLSKSLRSRTDTNEVLTEMRRRGEQYPLVNTFSDLEGAYSWLQRATTVTNQAAGSAWHVLLPPPQADA